MPVNAFPKKIYTNDSVIAYYQTCDLTDGTWTLLDSTSFINNVANAGTGNNISLNAVGVANDQLQIPGSGGTSVAPRWYKPAFFDDGTPVLGTDAFVLTVSHTIKGSTLNNMRYINWGFGISADPTSTTVATINHNLVGTGWNFANADADAFGVYFSDAVTGNASPVVATDVHCLSTIPMIGGNGNLTVSAVDASAIATGAGAAASSSTNYGAGQLFVQLTLGARGTSRTYTLGQETLIKLNYKFSRVNKVSAGI